MLCNLGGMAVVPTDKIVFNVSLCKICLFVLCMLFCNQGRLVYKLLKIRIFQNISTNLIQRKHPTKWQYCLHKLIIDYEIYLLYSRKQHKQSYPPFEEILTPYFQKKQPTLIHIQSLNTNILY